jgi:tripartite-type tricarboxylate transporter receptor subunit TctC
MAEKRPTGIGKKHHAVWLEFPSGGMGRSDVAGGNRWIFGPPRGADEWPTRAITFHVPCAPGSSTDPISRKYAELLANQPRGKVIFENCRGVGHIGAGTVIRDAPDGYTTPPLEHLTAAIACALRAASNRVLGNLQR